MRNVNVVKVATEATATIVASKAKDIHPEDLAEKTKEVYGALIAAINEAAAGKSEISSQE